MLIQKKTCGMFIAAQPPDQYFNTVAQTFGILLLNCSLRLNQTTSKSDPLRKTPGCAGGQLAGKQLCRKCLEGLGGQQVDWEPVMCLCKEDQQLSGLHQVESCQQVKGGDPSSLLNSGEATCGVLCPVLGWFPSRRQTWTY